MPTVTFKHSINMFVSSICSLIVLCTYSYASERDPISVGVEFGEKYTRSQCPIGDAFASVIRAKDMPSVYTEKHRVVLSSANNIWIFNDRKRADRESLSQNLFGKCHRSASGVAAVDFTFELDYPEANVELRAEMLAQAIDALRAQRAEAQLLHRQLQTQCETQTPAPELPSSPVTVDGGDIEENAPKILAAANLLQATTRLSETRLAACVRASDFALVFDLPPADDAPARQEALAYKSMTTAEFERVIPSIMRPLSESLWNAIASNMDVATRVNQAAALGRAVRDGETNPKDVPNVLDKFAKDVREQAIAVGISAKLLTMADGLTGGWCGNDGRATCERTAKEMEAEVVERIVSTNIAPYSSNVDIQWLRNHQKEAHERYARRVWERAKEVGVGDVYCDVVDSVRLALVADLISQARCDELVLEAMGAKCAEALRACPANRAVYTTTTTTTTRATRTCTWRCDSPPSYGGVGSSRWISGPLGVCQPDSNGREGSLPEGQDAGSDWVKVGCW
jgi:hypothetical protein